MREMQNRGCWIGPDELQWRIEASYRSLSRLSEKYAEKRILNLRSDYQIRIAQKIIEIIKSAKVFDPAGSCRNTMEKLKDWRSLVKMLNNRIRTWSIQVRWIPRWDSSGVQRSKKWLRTGTVKSLNTCVSVPKVLLYIIIKEKLNKSCKSSRNIF